jgi:RNA polymerase sigma-70 factor (ECF subfamily)
MSEFKHGVIQVIPQLRRYALSLTRDRHAADDLVQDVLVRAMERHKQFVPGTNLRAWLFTIMHNIFVDQVRKVAPFRASVAIDECRLTYATSAAQEPWIELKELAKSLHRLPLEQRTTLLLVGLEGLSYEETASVTGVAVGTVKSRISRAREALRQEATGSEKEPQDDPSDEESQTGGSQRLRRRRAIG